MAGFLAVRFPAAQNIKGTRKGVSGTRHQHVVASAFSAFKPCA